MCYLARLLENQKSFQRNDSIIALVTICILILGMGLALPNAYRLAVGIQLSRGVLRMCNVRMANNISNSADLSIHMT